MLAAMKPYRAIFSLILLLLLDSCECKLKAYPRHGRSEATVRKKRQDLNIFVEIHDCKGFYLFDVSPESLIAPEDCGTVRMIDSSMRFTQNSSTKPDPFLRECCNLKAVTFCVAGGDQLAPNYTNGDVSLGIHPADEPEFFWSDASVRESPISGNYIVEIPVYSYGPNLCCYLSLVDNNLTHLPENCYNGCEINTTPPVLTFHAIRFGYFIENDMAWYGLFTLCADSECKDRVVRTQLNNEFFDLFPIVMTII